MKNHEPYLAILKSQYLVQSRIALDEKLIKNIISIIQAQINYNQEDITYNTTNELNIFTGFYAPFINYYTTFSTTVITLLERLNIIKKSDIIRIEEIFTNPQDPLVYKYYDNIDNYKYFIEESYANITNELIYFQPICDIPHLLEAINNTSPIISIDNSKFEIFLDAQFQDKNTIDLKPLKTYSYFDLMSWIQCNSEHSRHWVFRTPLYLTDTNNTSLLELIKTTLSNSAKDNSIIAFCDNSSAIKGSIIYILSNSISKTDITTYEQIETLVHPTLTAETHNYPTYYHPFQGSATGVGGRIRDSLATGCGSISSASLTGYSVNSLSAGDLIVKVGPPAFKIGFGGSVMSSVDNTATDTGGLTAIQRGDPYNGNKVARFLETLALMEKPLIKKIHDQGAGGLANVVTELLDGCDANINLATIPAAEGMNSLECWISEYQEQMVFICLPESMGELEKIANREGVLLHTIGTILSSKTGTIYFDNLISNQPYEYRYNAISEHVAKLHPQEFYSKKLQEIHTITNGESNSKQIKHMNDSIIEFFSNYHEHNPLETSHCQEPLLERSFKCHLTNKIDRSVGGSVVQQACIGPFSLPLSNYAITRITPLSSGGILSAIGENIFIGQPISQWIDKTVCELLCNLIGVPKIILQNIKLSGNWMLNSKSPECLQVLHDGVIHLVSRLKELELAIDGGKDSLTMSMKTANHGTITSPPTLVLTSYSLIQESSISMRVNPLINYAHNETSSLYYIDFLHLLEIDIVAFQNEFALIQSLIKSGYILAIHDGSTVIDTLEEMAVASGVGIIISKSNQPKSSSCIFQHHYLVIQIEETMIFKLSKYWNYIAMIEPSNELSISYKETHEFKSLESIFQQRMKLSHELDTCAFTYRIDYRYYTYTWPAISVYSIIRLTSISSISSISSCSNKKNAIKIAIIRDEGSNSHREMAAAFIQFCNVVCLDFTINQLLDSHMAQTELLECKGVVFVGGFAWGDVLGSGRATALIMKTRMAHIWDPIFQNVNKFVLGVCNGCQILIEYGLLGDKVSMACNKSGKFESRWLPVKYTTPITQTEAVLGIWVAHGEGRFCLSTGWRDMLEPIGTYLSSQYPSNPNGSDNNVIGLKSKLARHYVIMPHPERSLFKWQCEWIPTRESSKYEGPYTPWIEFFNELINNN